MMPACPGPVAPAELEAAPARAELAGEKMEVEAATPAKSELAGVVARVRLTLGEASVQAAAAMAAHKVQVARRVLAARALVDHRALAAQTAAVERSALAATLGQAEAQPVEAAEPMVRVETRVQAAGWAAADLRRPATLAQADARSEPRGPTDMEAWRPQLPLGWRWEPSSVGAESALKVLVEEYRAPQSVILDGLSLNSPLLSYIAC